MSAKARKLLRQALKEYQSGDGASRQGAYRDAVTDLNHLALADEKMSVNFYPAIVNEAYDMFMEERQRQHAEWKTINKIPKRDLPKYIGHNWEFETSKELFSERIREK